MQCSTPSTDDWTPATSSPSFQAPRPPLLPKTAASRVDLFTVERAGVAELADALRSGRSGLYARGGSSPPSGTNVFNGLRGVSRHRPAVPVWLGATLVPSFSLKSPPASPGRGPSLMDCGAYVVDDTLLGRLCDRHRVESQGRVTDQFEAVWGWPLETSSQTRATELTATSSVGRSRSSGRPGHPERRRSGTLPPPPDTGPHRKGSSVAPGPNSPS